MKCPFCACGDSRVIDSREVSDGIRRRRQCQRCDGRFTTYERVQPVGVLVIKKDGRREAFERDKVLRGVEKACEKRVGSADAVDRIVDEVEAEVYALERAEVPSRAIGDIVMRRLRGLDQVAYIRFASVYREFADITALKDEIETLLDAREGGDVASTQLPLLADEEIGGVSVERRRRSQ